MKFNNKIFIAFGAALILATLPSCDIINKITGKSNPNTTATPVKVEKAVSKTTTSSKPNSAATATKQASKKEKPTVEAESDQILPRDREHISQSKETPAYTSQEIGRGILKGDWAIETVNGKPAIGEKAPFIRFSPSEKMIYGNNGCNVINGQYIYNPADSTITFSNIASTMMLCNKEGLTDYEINAALDVTRSYRWEIKNDDYYLYFLDSAKQTVMTLMHQNFQFLNGTWAVSAIDGKTIDEPDMKLVIDVDEGKIHGNTGCNILNGSMEIDMDKANSISFSGIATTRMACPPDSHQTALLVALEDASSAKPLSKTSVVLLNSARKEVLRLVRSSEK